MGRMKHKKLQAVVDSVGREEVTLDGVVGDAGKASLLDEVTQLGIAQLAGELESRRGDGGGGALVGGGLSVGEGASRAERASDSASSGGLNNGWQEHQRALTDRLWRQARES